MKILLIGSGAREHAIAKTLQRSETKPILYSYAESSHPGLVELCAQFVTGDFKDIAAQALEWNIDFAIIGPESALALGVADALWAVNIPVMGPKQVLAKIETSKVFARDLMQRYAIPGSPRYQFFQSIEGVRSFLTELKTGFVIKVDGLAGGKGVKVSGEHLFSVEEGYQFCESLIEKNTPFLIEEKLIGQEFSLMGFCDGQDIFFMPIVQDHKRVGVGDTGPNTGGMGSYSDANHSLPFLSEKDIVAAQDISRSVFLALQKDCQQAYHGILYGSFIATKDGLGVIEFNARFGDPEAMNVLAILQSDFALLCEALVKGKLTSSLIQFAPYATVCKYTVPEGYPESAKSNCAIDVSKIKNAEMLYLGAVHGQKGQLYTGSSRTAAIVGVAKTLCEAEKLAEENIQLIAGPLFHREDIGTKMQIDRKIIFMQQLRAE